MERSTYTIEAVGDRWFIGPLPKGSKLPAISEQGKQLTVWGRCHRVVMRIAGQVEQKFPTYKRVTFGRVAGQALYQITFQAE